MDDNLRAWLLLSRLPRCGLQTLARLRQLGSGTAILRAGRDRLATLGLAPRAIDQLKFWLNRPDSQPGGDELGRIEAWLDASPRHRLLCLDDADYPPALAAIPDPPPLLYLVGDAELLRQPQLAIVGSRHASVTGLETARAFARALSQAGPVPTSGLALGIDGAAHRGALEGLGLTVAVLGTGVDRVYPRRHRALADQILAQGGALVSPFPLGTEPRASHFPQRNRIISGLSLGVLVVEAAANSGSLITARYALEQGRELFAMPGSIHNPAARGCHELIRQGAKLVETVMHVLEEIGPQLEPPAPEPAPPQPALEAEPARLLAAVGYEPTPVDRVVARSGLPAERVLAGLLDLELAGRVLAVAGGYQRA